MEGHGRHRTLAKGQRKNRVVCYLNTEAPGYGEYGKRRYELCVEPLQIAAANLPFRLPSHGRHGVVYDLCMLALSDLVSTHIQDKGQVPAAARL